MERIVEKPIASGQSIDPIGDIAEPTLATRLCAAYPALGALPPAVLADLLACQAHHLHVPAGQHLFDEGSPCAGFPLLLDGEVRVARGSPGGRSLELYRVGVGELCVASTASLFGQRPLVAHGRTSVPSELVVLSPAAFERCCETPAFRRHVFGIFGDRLADLMTLVEAVAFQRVDQRLAAALLGHGPVRQVTQQALADELGTVREIVSRLLKRFERAGWIRLGRERIELRDAGALRRHAAGESATPPGTPPTTPPAADGPPTPAPAQDGR